MKANSTKRQKKGKGTTDPEPMPVLVPHQQRNNRKLQHPHRTGTKTTRKNQFETKAKSSETSIHQRSAKNGRRTNGACDCARIVKSESEAKRLRVGVNVFFRQKEIANGGGGGGGSGGGGGLMTNCAIIIIIIIIVVFVAVVRPPRSCLPCVRGRVSTMRDAVTSGGWRWE
uniref:Uncharacterized protein n=1 Tax=Anopheles farauti TaxID=69004 RepID=A0A182Q936_9DIPT